MSMVRSTRSVMTGSLVVADVVLQAPFDQGDAGQTRPVRREILKLCHDRLAPHKIPAMIRFVATLEIADAGKLVRDA
jgi:acyl-coenzyme A synthetase/AMP-(fatty) acid ligase